MKLKFLFTYSLILILTVFGTSSFYLFLFRSSVLNITIPRFDIQRYSENYENILVIGDSFFDPQWPFIFEMQKSLLSEHKINLINVSESNQGPQHHLEAIKYYVSNFQFKKVIILFYGGNDLVDLYQPQRDTSSGRLQKRGDFFNSQYYIFREIFKKLFGIFPQNVEEQDYIFFRGLNNNKDALLINDLIIQKEETMDLLQKFISDTEALKNAKKFKLGCFYVPASRSIDSGLFSWWQKKKVNWDDRLKFNTSVNETFSKEVAPICDWFYEDLTPKIKSLLGTGKQVYFPNDPHFDPSFGLKEFLKLVKARILKAQDHQN